MSVNRKVKNAIVWMIPIITTVLSVYYISLALKQDNNEVAQYKSHVQQLNYSK